MTMRMMARRMSRMMESMRGISMMHAMVAMTRKSPHGGGRKGRTAVEVHGLHHPV